MHAKMVQLSLMTLRGQQLLPPAYVPFDRSAGAWKLEHVLVTGCTTYTLIATHIPMTILPVYVKLVRR